MAITVRLDDNTETALRELATAEGVSLDDALEGAIYEQHARAFQVSRVMASAAHSEHRFAGLLQRLADGHDAEDLSIEPAPRSGG